MDSSQAESRMVVLVDSGFRMNRYRSLSILALVQLLFNHVYAQNHFQNQFAVFVPAGRQVILMSKYFFYKYTKLIFPQ